MSNQASTPKLTRWGNPNASKALILVHGGPGMDASYFGSSFADLRADLEVVTYDQAQTPAVTDIESLVSELNAVTSQLGNKQIFLLGHSFGAALVIEQVRKYPRPNIAALILMNATVDASWLGAFNNEFRSTPQYSDAMQYIANIDQNLSADEKYKFATMAWKEFYFAPHEQTNGEAMLSRVRYNSNLRTAVQKSYMGSFSHLDWLKETKIPIAVIHSEYDRVVTKSYVEKFCQYANIKNFYKIDGAGHFPFFEAPDAVNAVIRQIITQ